MESTKIGLSVEKVWSVPLSAISVRNVTPNLICLLIVLAAEF
jgi:hypothetical protein